MTTPFPPALITISGRRFVVPMWKEVPLDTSWDEIEWIKPVRSVSNGPVKEKTVTGSTGNEYEVKIYADGSATCECWGYRRHKNCKHIKEVKNE